MCTLVCKRTWTTPELYIYAQADSGYIRLLGLPFNSPVERPSGSSGSFRVLEFLIYTTRLTHWWLPQVEQSVFSFFREGGCGGIWSFFSPTYLTGYIQYVQYLSTSPNSNQSNLSSVTLPGCNLESPLTFPIHSSFSPLKIKNFYGPVTAHILRMGGKCGEREKTNKKKKCFTVKSQKDLPFLWTMWIKVQLQTLNKPFLEFWAVAAIQSQMRQARLNLFVHF